MTENEIARRSPQYHQLQELDVTTYVTSDWHAPFHFGASEDRADEYDVPNHVGEASTIGIEHQASRDTAGLCDLASLAPIEVTGPDAADLLQTVCSNDMDISIGRVRYTMILNEEGGVLADVVVTRLDHERYYVVTFGGPTASSITEWISDYAPSDVSVTNLDDARASIGVWGPAARDIVQPLTDNDMSDSAFSYFTSQEFEVAGIPVVGQRVSYVGELGWELCTPMGYASELWDRLWESGQEHDAVAMGFGALDAMGVEKGNRFLGYDIGPDHNPFEAAVDIAVDMDTDFVGKAALEDALADGIDEKIACITMDDETVHPDVGAEVFAGGESVSETARTAYGYSVEESIAYAYVPVEYAEPGVEVEIEVDGTRHSGTVQEEPRFDPERNRV
jgi:glycine cleavage system aminomethyltransferase T